MKKSLFSIGLLLLFAALVPLSGIASKTAALGAENATAATALFTAERMQSVLAEFIGDGSEGNDRADRTSFRDGRARRRRVAGTETAVVRLYGRSGV